MTAIEPRATAATPIAKLRVFRTIVSPLDAFVKNAAMVSLNRVNTAKMVIRRLVTAVKHAKLLPVGAVQSQESCAINAATGYSKALSNVTIKMQLPAMGARRA
jgi:hypothetical protein